MKTGSDNPFAELRGIAAGRKQKPRQKTVLDNLIEIEEKVLRLWDFPAECIALRDAELPKFDEDDLRDYILARANHERNASFNGEARKLGHYTASLLFHLMKRRRLERKPAVFSIDGNGAYFPYLFCGLTGADEVHVANFCGDYIGKNIIARKIACFSGIRGDCVACSSGADDKKNAMELLVLEGITGRYAGENAGGHYKHIEAVILTDVEDGYGAGHGIGSCDSAASDLHMRSSVGLAVLNNIRRGENNRGQDIVRQGIGSGGGWVYQLIVRNYEQMRYGLVGCNSNVNRTLVIEPDKQGTVEPVMTPYYQELTLLTEALDGTHGEETIAIGRKMNRLVKEEFRQQQLQLRLKQE